MQLTDGQKTRFSKMVKTSAGNCWEWQGSLIKEGYGCFKIDGVNHAAHRLSYEAFYGDIPDGLLILHKCGNRSCVNPDHLYAGNNSQNALDALRMGTHGVAKLSLEDVKVIKQLLAEGDLTHEQIADKYGVTRPTISCIKSGKSWGWVE